MPKVSNQEPVEDQEEDIICEAIYSEWTEDQLDTLALEKDVRRDFSRKYLSKHGITEKEAYVNELSVYTRNVGMKNLISSFSKELLGKLTEPLDEGYLTSEGKNKINNTVLAKRLYEKMAEFDFGLIKYVGECGFGVDIYNDLLLVLNEEPKSTKRKYLYGQLNEALEVFYLRSVLHTIPANFLKMVCEGIRIKVGKCNSPQIIADCMIYGNHYVPERYYFGFLGPIPSVTKKPKRIKDGLTKGDLEYWFTIDDLKHYCTDIGVKSSGKKQELAARIVTFWEDAKENHEEDVDMGDWQEKPKTKKSNKGGQGRKKKASRPMVEPLGERNIDQEANTKKSNKGKEEKSSKHERVHHETEPMLMDSESSDDSDF